MSLLMRTSNSVEGSHLQQARCFAHRDIYFIILRLFSEASWKNFPFSNGIYNLIEKKSIYLMFLWIFMAFDSVIEISLNEVIERKIGVRNESNWNLRG